MLDVLKFKKSLFAGVLDGGEEEVFLGGTRLKKFMESVERATAAIPASAPETVLPEAEIDAEQLPEEEDGGASAPAPAAPGAAEPAAAQLQQWGKLLSAGRAFLDNLGQAVASAQTPSAASAALPNPLVARDPQTGQPFLKLPLPH